MSKIDCGVTVNYLREHARMCKYYIACVKCHECPMGSSRNGKGYNCESLLFEHPETAVEIVQKWSNERPQKTRLDDLNEKYPKYRFYENDQCPDIRPAVFGYCNACPECRNKKQTLRYCWHEPVDGGATGKAVE